MVRSAVAVAGLILAAGMFPASAAPDSKGVEHHSDFGVTLSGPKESSVEGRATYKMEITNSVATSDQPLEGEQLLRRQYRQGFGLTDTKTL